MLMQKLSLSGFPNGTSSGLDMTADFAPLFIGLWVILGLCILGLAVATALQDNWWAQRKTKPTTDRPAPLPDLPKVA